MWDSAGVRKVLTRVLSSVFLVLAMASLAAGPKVGSTVLSDPLFAESEPHPLPAAVPATFFGMHRHAYPKRPDPWPEIPFGSFRMWDSATGWAQINTAKGQYDWSQVDTWFADLQQHGVQDVLYTFGKVPPFASSRPTADCNYGPGQCAPPKDLDAEGNGPDQYWKDFVTAIATHSKNNRGIHIKYWELWNEPYLPRMWSGTIPQLLRMARDAREIIHGIDPDAVFLTPPSGLQAPRTRDFMEDWLAAGGGQFADGIAFHGYVHAPAPATDFVKYYAEFRKILTKHGQESKPVIDTEASWGNTSDITDEDLQSAFITQFYLVHWSQGVQRLYWYAYNDGATGKLYNREQGRAGKAARAYRELYQWMVGSTMTKACTPDGAIWTCGLSTKDGHEAVVVWSEAGEKSYTPKPTFKNLKDLEGHASPVSGALKISPRPVLLEAP